MGAPAPERPGTRRRGGALQVTVAADTGSGRRNRVNPAGIVTATARMLRDGGRSLPGGLAIARVT
jgi:hypothetical protein